MKDRLSKDQLAPFARSFAIFDRIEKIFYADAQAFKDEYDCLLPKINDENFSRVVIFSHNDTQENNFLYGRHGDKKITKIIDFEYSQPNYRGADLASYANESTINYKVKEKPFFIDDD